MRFFTELGSGSPEEIADGLDDDDAAEADNPPTLYAIHVVDGVLTLKTIGVAPLKQEMLKTKVWLYHNVSSSMYNS